MVRAAKVEQASAGGCKSRRKRTHHRMEALFNHYWTSLQPEEGSSLTESERARTWMLHQFLTTTVSSAGEKVDDVSPVHATKGRRRRTRHLPFLSSLIHERHRLLRITVEEVSGNQHVQSATLDRSGEVQGLGDC